MEYKYTEEINYQYEACALIARHYSDSDNYDQLKQHLIEKKMISKELIEKLMTPILQIEADVFSQVHIDAKAYDFYFTVSVSEGKDNSNDNSLYRMLNSVDDLRLSSLDYRKKKFAALLFDENYASKNIQKLRDEDFLKRLKQLDMSAEFKWNAYDVYSNLDEHIQLIKKLTQPVIEILKKYEALLKQIIHDNPYKDHLYYLQKNAALASILDEEYTIYFTVMGFNEVSVQDYSIDDCNRSIMFYSVYVDIMINEENRQENISERASRKLKKISDKSRIKILCELKAQDMCGQELKEALHLSNATISHHMSELMAGNFVSMRKDENKVIYSINQKVIEETIEDLKKLLLDN